MLETIREYALEQLEASGEAAITPATPPSTSSWRWPSGRAELHGPEQAAWLDRLEAEHDNLRAALAWSLAERRRRRGGTAAGGGRSYRFWWRRGHLTRRARRGCSRRWWRAGTGAAPARAHGAQALGEGRAARARTQGDHRRRRARASRRAWRSVASSAIGLGIAQVLTSLGTCWRPSETTQARGLPEESLTLWRELGDRGGCRRALIGSGSSCTIRATRAPGALAGREPGAGARAERSPGASAGALPAWRVWPMPQGDDDASEARCSRRRWRCAAAGDQYGIAVVAERARAAGAAREATRRATERCFARACGLCRRLGDTAASASAWSGWRGVGRRAVAPKRAARLLGAAAVLREASARRSPPPSGRRPRA